MCKAPSSRDGKSPLAQLRVFSWHLARYYWPFFPQRKGHYQQAKRVRGSALRNSPGAHCRALNISTYECFYESGPARKLRASRNFAVACVEDIFLPGLL